MEGVQPQDVVQMDDDELPPPPYHEVLHADPPQGSNPTSDARKLHFLSKAQELRHVREVDTFRWFLLTLLKIDYGIDTRSNQEALQTNYFAIHIFDHLQLYMDLVGDNLDDAADLYLEQMPEVVKALNLDRAFLRQWLIDYRNGLRKTKDHLYHSFLENSSMKEILNLLWWHREEAIDALVPPRFTLLWSSLHTARLEKERALFKFLQNPTDFALTPLGKRVDRTRVAVFGYGSMSIAQAASRFCYDEVRPVPLRLVGSRDSEACRPESETRCLLM